MTLHPDHLAHRAARAALLAAQRETDAAIQSAQATPDDDATHHAETLRFLATRLHRITPGESAALNAAAAWIERQS